MSPVRRYESKQRHPRSQVSSRRSHDRSRLGHPLDLPKSCIWYLIHNVACELPAKAARTLTSEILSRTCKTPRLSIPYSTVCATSKPKSVQLVILRGRAYVGVSAMHPRHMHPPACLLSLSSTPLCSPPSSHISLLLTPCHANCYACCNVASCVTGHSTGHYRSVLKVWEDQLGTVLLSADRIAGQG